MNGFQFDGFCTFAQCRGTRTASRAFDAAASVVEAAGEAA